MNNNKDVLLLISILESEVKVYRNLLNIILAEYELLVNRDYDAIHDQLNVKNSIFKEVVALEQKRKQILTRISEVNDKPIDNVSDLVYFITDEKIKANLITVKDVLKMLVSRISEANKINSDFVEHSKEVFNSVVNNLKDLFVKKDNAGLYSKKGKIDESNKQKGSILINKEV